MSVLARKRNLSDLEFWKNANEIRAVFTRYLMSESHIPKRWPSIKSRFPKYATLICRGAVLYRIPKRDVPSAKWIFYINNFSAYRR